MDQSHEYKTSKYEDFKKELEKEGYSVIVKAVEIRARGFVSGTLYQFLSRRERRDCMTMQTFLIVIWFCILGISLGSKSDAIENAWIT